MAETVRMGIGVGDIANSVNHKYLLQQYFFLKLLCYYHFNRFFVLTGNEVRYFVDESQSSQKGSFPLQASCTVEYKPATSKKKFLFLLAETEGTEKRNLMINAPDSQSYQKWFLALKEVIEGYQKPPSRKSTSNEQNSSVVNSTETGAVDNVKTVAESSVTDAIISGTPGLVLKVKIPNGKVFINVLLDSSIALSAVILGNDCPHAVPDKDGNLNDTYDVCINGDSKSTDFYFDVSVDEVTVGCGA